MKTKVYILLFCIAVTFLGCSTKDDIATQNTILFDLELNGDLILSQNSPDMKKIAFRSDNLREGDQQHFGYDCFYIKDLDNAKIHFIGAGFHHFTWDTNSNMFVTLSGLSPSKRYTKLKLYSGSMEYLETIFEVEKGWLISGSSIRFIDDDTKIGFILREEETKLCEYWIIDLETKLATKIHDIFDPNLSPSYRLTWNSDLSHIYFDHRTESKILNMYKYNVQTGETESVINSTANESKPSLSPNDKHLVYLSDKTGELGIWAKNLETGKQTELKLPKGFIFDTRYNYLQWINNDEILVTLENRDLKLKLYKLKAAW